MNSSALRPPAGVAALAAAAWLIVALAPPAAAFDGKLSHPQPGGTVARAACRIVGTAARTSHVPVSLLTRLVWAESRFQPDATSSKGAQGIAQFMPETAAERGLANPFDPEQAIPKAARLLADLERRFGNIGLAAAAYNAGPDRVAKWLAGSAALPLETRAYVLEVTGRTARDWAAERRPPATDPPGDQSCLAVTAELRTSDGVGRIPVAPWGVQLAGNFSKSVALASYGRAEWRYARIIGEVPPMVIGTVVPSRGRRPFYRVLVPASSRATADRICSEIKSIGGACVALRS